MSGTLSGVRDFVRFSVGMLLTYVNFTLSSVPILELAWVSSGCEWGYKLSRDGITLWSILAIPIWVHL